MWPDRLCSDEEHDRPGAKNFKKIVLVYNGANAFELTFVKDYP